VEAGLTKSHSVSGRWIDEKIIILTRSEDFIQRRLLALLVWDPRKCK